jgi:hypothetical protein
VLGTVDPDHLGLRNGGKPATSLVGLQVVVELGHERRDRLAGLGPRRQMVVRAESQRRRQQDQTLDGGVETVHERQVGAERPPDQPDVGEVGELGVLDGRRDVELLVLGVVELAAAGALDAAGAAGVEPQHGDAGERGEPVRRLAEQVAVHHAAVSRQRVQADHRGHRVAVDGQGQLPHQVDAVGRLQRQRLALRREDGVASDDLARHVRASSSSTPCASDDARR